ncbi:hypothetical protein GCM10009550_23700 [Actinocorallia libanotica]|uniref:Secreted protein n=1 Tax=Actinocorallia libanotica TaxID=46162 RepID=A0ABP4BH35_9ACTN
MGSVSSTAATAAAWSTTNDTYLSMVVLPPKKSGGFPRIWYLAPRHWPVQPKTNQRDVAPTATRKIESKA